LTYLKENAIRNKFKLKGGVCMAEETKSAPKPEAKKPVANDKVVEEGKQLAWLSYIGILFLVPLLAKKDNAFCMHHAKQGLVLFIFWIAVFIVGIIIAAVPVIGWVLSPIILGFGSLFIVVLAVIGIIQSVQGNWWEAPIGIHGLSKKFNF
jgi:uncharacterized membrane protein